MVRPPGHDSVTILLVQAKAVNCERVSGSGSNDDVSFRSRLRAADPGVWVCCLDWASRWFSCSNAFNFCVKNSTLCVRLAHDCRRWSFSCVRRSSSAAFCCFKTMFSFSTSLRRLRIDFIALSRSMVTSAWNCAQHNYFQAPRSVHYLTRNMLCL